MDEKKVLIISVVTFCVLLIVAFFISGTAMRTNFIVAAVVILIAPYNVYKFFQFKKIKTYEKEFPVFLRDVAEAKRVGLSIIQAIESVSGSEYGSFTKEVKKIKNQLSWNIPLEQVLRNFSKRTKKSRLITRAVEIIIEANKSGGNVEETMISLASNMEMIKEVGEERSTVMGQHIFMMYAIFFIFLAISIILIKFLVPLLQAQPEEGQAMSLGIIQYSTSPCVVCAERTDMGCFGCRAFAVVSEAFDFGGPTTAEGYYKSIFFIMVIVQGLFSGLIAGQVGSDSVIAGAKHSMIMVLTGLVTFLVTSYIGFI